jgi:hypothetical protein
MDGGRVHKFFRTELSFSKDEKKTTFLGLEMFICSEYLHIPHCEFKKLPRHERLLWYIYVEEKGKEQEKRDKEMSTKRKMDEMKRNADPSPGLKG